MITQTDDPATIKYLIEAHASVIVDFSTEWCGPCKMLAQDLKAIEQKYGDVVIIKVDKDVVAGRRKVDGQIDEAGFEQELPFYADVNSLGGVPVIVFLKDGKPIDKILDEGERMNGMIYGYIPGVKTRGSTAVSIEEIMAREKMIPEIKAPEKPVATKKKPRNRNHNSKR